MTVFLILINFLFFIWAELKGGTQDLENMIACGAIYPPLLTEGGEYYRLLTGMFLHFGMEHLLNNMLILFVLGQRLEPVCGKLIFLIVYFVGGLGGNVISLYLEQYRLEYWSVSAGASGAVFAVMGAMLYVLIRNKGRVQDLSARQILIMAAFSLYFGFTSSGVDNAAHVGGLLCGFIAALIFYHPKRKY